jgi:hypothetical protein
MILMGSLYIPIGVKVTFSGSQMMFATVEFEEQLETLYLFHYGQLGQLWFRNPTVLHSVLVL